jgi:hypothetical protein
MFIVQATGDKSFKEIYERGLWLYQNKERHDIRNNDTQRNDNQRNDTQLNDVAMMMHKHQ